MVAGQQRRVDSTKLHSLVSEVATVPLTSSVKDCLLTVWEDLVQRAATNPASQQTSIAAAAAAAAAVGGVDTSAKTSSDSTAAAAATGGAAAGATTTKRAPKASQLAAQAAVPGIAAFAYLPSESVYLSDDEGNDSSDSSYANDNPQANLLAAMPNSKDVILTALPPHSWASLPSNMWPPALAVSRYLPRKMVPSAVAYPSLPSLAVHK